jgi:hypothetical protein
MDSEEGTADVGVGVWMTYTELAAARGIARAGAIRLVQRQRWQRRAGSNDGLAHVLVPHDWAKPIARAPAKRQRPAQRPATSPPAYATAFETALTALREQQAHERGAWEYDRTAWTEERTRLQAMVDAMRGEIDGLELERNTLRALSRWARIRRAWRGA